MSDSYRHFEEYQKAYEVSGVLRLSNLCSNTSRDDICRAITKTPSCERCVLYWLNLPANAAGEHVDWCHAVFPDRSSREEAKAALRGMLVGTRRIKVETFFRAFVSGALAILTETLLIDLQQKSRQFRVMYCSGSGLSPAIPERANDVENQGHGNIQASESQLDTSTPQSVTDESVEAAQNRDLVVEPQPSDDGNSEDQQGAAMSSSSDDYIGGGVKLYDSQQLTSTSQSDSDDISATEISGGASTSLSSNGNHAGVPAALLPRSPATKDHMEQQRPGIANGNSRTRSHSGMPENQGNGAMSPPPPPPQAPRSAWIRRAGEPADYYGEYLVYSFNGMYAGKMCAFLVSSTNPADTMEIAFIPPQPTGYVDTQDFFGFLRNGG